MDWEVRFPVPDSDAVLMHNVVTDPSDAEWRVRYTTPPAEWTSPAFDDSSWSRSPAAIGEFCCADPFDDIETTWPGGTVAYARREFQVDDPTVDLALWGRWDDSVEIYINGVLAATRPTWSPAYRYVDISDNAQQALVAGTNTIAVRATDFGGGRYLDFAVVEHPLADPPVDGYVVNPQLEPIRDLAIEFARDNMISAMSVTVSKHGRDVLNLGIGYRDKHLTDPFEAGSFMRIASVGKPVTAAASRELIAAGYVDPTTGLALTLDTPVFPILEHFGLTPYEGVTPDPRTADVTLRHLIDHRSGLSELPGGQQMLALSGGPIEDYTPDDNARYIYSQPLAFDPGFGDQYCSSCYFLIAYLVDKLSGDFFGFTQDALFAGFHEPAFAANFEPLAFREPSEPWYETLQAPADRGIYLEHFFAIVMTGPGLTEFMDGYNLGSGVPLVDPFTGAWAAVPDNGGTGFGGAFEGSRSAAIQRRWDRLNITVVFNTDVDPFALAGQIEDLAGVLDSSAFTPSDPTGRAEPRIGDADFFDLISFLDAVEERDPATDIDGSGGLPGTDDILRFLAELDSE